MMGEYYIFAGFVFVMCLILIFAVYFFIVKEKNPNIGKDKEVKLLRLYSQVEEMMESLEEYADEVKSEIRDEKVKVIKDMRVEADEISQKQRQHKREIDEAIKRQRTEQEKMSKTQPNVIYESAPVTIPAPMAGEAYKAAETKKNNLRGYETEDSYRQTEMQNKSSEQTQEYRPEDILKKMEMGSQPKQIKYNDYAEPNVQPPALQKYDYAEPNVQPPVLQKYDYAEPNVQPPMPQPNVQPPVLQKYDYAGPNVQPPMPQTDYVYQPQPESDRQYDSTGFNEVISNQDLSIEAQIMGMKKSGLPINQIAKKMNKTIQEVNLIIMKAKK